MDQRASIQTRIEALLEQGRLKPPGLPDIALRVRRAVQDENIEIADLARLIQTDIPLMGRLIQVVNSPLYRGDCEIDNLHAAITRLGLEVTRNLVLSFSLRRSFTSKHARLNRVAKENWKHSVKVAAIAFVLARVTPRLDPEQALLGGLLHNVGILPVLAYAERDLDLIRDTELFQSLVQGPQPRLAALVLKQWRFEPEFIDQVRQMGLSDRYGLAVAELADVVIVARLLANLGSTSRRALEELEGKAVIARFPLFELGTGAALELLSEAREEMIELTELLSQA